MKRLLLTWLGLGGLLGATAAAQDHARGSLYVRTEGRRIQAAIQIVIEPGFHLYHGPTRQDMGPPDAVGNPTTVEFTGIDATWGTVRFPKPKRIEQEIGMEDKPTFIFGHEGT